MLKKRFIGVITVKDGWAVQSFGYRRYLPIGRPTVVAENLDRWGADEIMVLAIDRSAQQLGPDLDLLEGLGGLSLSTPLTYGGGIHDVEQATLVIQAGAERICLDTALQCDLGVVREISMHIGSQALVASLPLGIKNGQLQLYSHVLRTQRPANEVLPLIFEDGLISEALVIDWENEGVRNGFNLTLLSGFPVDKVPLIAFGGLSDVNQIQLALNMPKVVGVGIGNFLNYREHSVQKYKEYLASTDLRAPEYQGFEY